MSNLTELTEGPSGSSKTFTEGPSGSSKPLELRTRLLLLLAQNNGDHFENPHDFQIIKNIASELEISKSTATYHIQKLEQQGYIKYNKKKSDFYRSYTFGNAKIYHVTRKGIKYVQNNGGSFGKFEGFTGGPQKFELENLHGDLIFKYEVLSSPNNDPVRWDRVNEISNGTMHKIKTLIGPSNQRATIELFEGKNKSTLTMKPRLKGVDPDELVDAMNELAWAIYSDIQKNGYDISMPNRSGEGKFTIISEQLPDRFKEGDNFLIDRSEGEKELHPRTGDFETNLEMTKMLTETGYMARASKKIDKLANKTNRVPKLEQKIDVQGSIISKQNEVIEKLAHQIDSMSNSINKLGNALNNALNGEQEQQPPTSPGGHMYG